MKQNHVRNFEARILAAVVTALVLLASSAAAEMAPEVLGRSLRVGPAEPQWTYYYDFQLASFHGRYVLMDTDNADFLAFVSAGQMSTLSVAPNGKEIYVVETTYEYGVGGERHDFVTIYDTTDYATQARIDLPTGKRAIMASLRRTTLLGDPRFLAVYNYTPATSMSLVDLEKRRHTVEVPVPGCHLAYATGARGVSMLCGDGSLITLHFDDAGELASQLRSKPFFDPRTDHLKTNAALHNGVAYFISYSGDIYPVDFTGESPQFEKPWPIVDHDKKPAGMLSALFTMGKSGPWLPGGMKLADTHASRGELYVIVHPTLWSEGKGDHDFPGPEVWVFDLKSKKRLRRLKMRGVAMSIGVTQGPEPRLVAFGANIKTEEQHLEIYDAVTGKYLREMHEYGDAVLSFDHVPFNTPKQSTAKTEGTR